MSKTNNLKRALPIFIGNSTKWFSNKSFNKEMMKRYGLTARINHVVHYLNKVDTPSGEPIIIKTFGHNKRFRLNFDLTHEDILFLQRNQDKLYHLDSRTKNKVKKRKASLLQKIVDFLKQVC